MGKKNSGSKEAAQARADEQARQDRIRRGTADINSLFDREFSDSFFDSRAKAYRDYAMPQLDDQYGETQRDLTFALTRAGLLDSSVRADKTADLSKAYDIQRQGVVDQGEAEATSARNAVEDSRANLISMLNVTGDAQGAVNAALARSTALSRPGNYSPLTQLFADFTSGLGQQAALERANFYSGGAYGGRYNTGLFAPRSGSVRVSGG